jgi:hypothetical protein
MNMFNALADRVWYLVLSSAAHVAGFITQNLQPVLRAFLCLCKVLSLRRASADVSKKYTGLAFSRR